MNVNAGSLSKAENYKSNKYVFVVLSLKALSILKEMFKRDFLLNVSSIQCHSTLLDHCVYFSKRGFCLDLFNDSVFEKLKKEICLLEELTNNGNEFKSTETAFYKELCSLLQWNNQIEILVEAESRIDDDRDF